MLKRDPVDFESTLESILSTYNELLDNTQTEIKSQVSSASFST